MSDSYVTVTGNLTKDPQRKFGKASGTPFTVFGVAQNLTRRDANGEIVDMGTSFFEVIAFRALGDNCAATLSKGDPVVVQGRLRINNWESEERRGTTVQIDATHIGHDLLFGTTVLTKRRAVPPSQDRISTEVNGAPASVNADGEVFEHERASGEPSGGEAESDLDVEATGYAA